MNRDTLIIEIFGKGCKNCDRLEHNAKLAAEELGLKYEIKKIKDLNEIAERGVFKTPGLGINGEVVSTGRVLSSKKIKSLI